jgi:hypothetical protein
VHRDFKPDNVLLGEDGTVRVADFGLARLVVGEAPPTLEEEAEDPTDPGRGVVALTQTGTLMGTPAYMAPEQHEREPTDARTDQFSFCVALWEGLYGEHPFTGARIGSPPLQLAALSAAVCAGQLRAPSRREVPSWLRDVLARGLAVDPAARHPSMRALLAELSRDPARAWRRMAQAAGALAVLAAGGGAVALALRHGAASAVCSGAERKLTGVWDAPRKEAVRSRFLASGKPFAIHMWHQVSGQLDGYTASIVAMNVEACEAAQVRRVEAPALQELRTACLDERLHEVKALTDLLAGADADVVQRAAQAAGALSRLDECADATTLQGTVPLPGDAELRAKIASLRNELADERALESAGKLMEGAARVATTAAAARPP